MSLLSNLKSKLFQTHKYSSAGLYPDVAAFSQHINARNYGAAEALFNSASKIERSYFIEAVSDMFADDHVFDDWVETESAIAKLFQGAHLTKRAWYYRGGGKGEDVGENAGDMMQNLLGKAHNILVPIAADEELGQEAAAKLIRISMGLGDNLSEIANMHKMLRQFDRPHFFGELNYLIASCKKWGGSHDAMFGAAQSAIDCYSEHPEMGGLMAAAHWERHLYYTGFDRDEAAGAAYLKNRKIFDEVNNLGNKLLRSPQTKGYEAVAAHNIYSIFYCDRDLWRHAKPHFVDMNLRFTRYPWECYNDSFLKAARKISMRQRS